MLKIVAIAVAVVIVAILAVAATRPDTFRVERTATLQAPPEKIEPLIDDFHRWAEWSPYEKLDPAMKKTYGGAPSGKGATYEWAGNGKAGQGRMEILDSSPDKVAIQLDFLKPFESRNLAEFTLVPQGGATRVTWAMSGPMPFISKVMCLFVSMDKMVGDDFATGLANLKALAEK